MALSFSEQVEQLVRLLQVLPASGTTQKALEEILTTSAPIPRKFFPPDFADQIAVKFGVDRYELRKFFTTTSGIGVNEDFDSLVPTSGWLHDYIEYTRQTEPPTVFHFFAGVTVMGATIARRLRISRGSGDIFPNVCCVLVAPAGKCKKTTACNKAVNLFRRIGGNVLADKITPEAIVESFKTSTTATGLIYAPEWSVFLGKQQYMEGLVPMLTALFDCPAIWSSHTIMRSVTQLQNVALSHLAASTLDWIQTSITKDAFSGGFMSRLLFIVQHDTPRRFPMPPPLDTLLEKRLIDGLLALQQVTGDVTFSPEGDQWYRDWYMNRKISPIERQLAGYFERKPDRLLQLAMVLNAAKDPRNLELDQATLEHSEKILNWIEKLLPGAFSELASTTAGDDQFALLKQIRFHKGEIGYTEWLRMNRSRMTLDTFKKGVELLKQAGMVTEDKGKKVYYLLPAGWRED